MTTVTDEQLTGVILRCSKPGCKAEHTLRLRSDVLIEKLKKPHPLACVVCGMPFDSAVQNAIHAIAEVWAELERTKQILTFRVYTERGDHG